MDLIVLMLVIISPFLWSVSIETTWFAESLNYMVNLY